MSNDWTDGPGSLAALPAGSPVIVELRGHRVVRGVVRQQLAGVTAVEAVVDGELRYVTHVDVARWRASASPWRRDDQVARVDRPYEFGAPGAWRGVVVEAFGDRVVCVSTDGRETVAPGLLVSPSMPSKVS